MLRFVLLDLGENLPVGTTTLLQQLTKEQIPFCFFPAKPTTDYPIPNSQFFKTQIGCSEKTQMIEEHYDTTSLTEQKLHRLLLLINKQQLQSKDCLLITNCPTLALAAKNTGFVCFGYCDAGSSVRFPSISLVLEGLEDVELSFLKREFAHALHEPADICETSRCDIKELPLADIPILYEMLQQKCSLRGTNYILPQSKTEQPNSHAFSLTDVHTTNSKKDFIPFLLEPLGTLSEELEKHEAYIRYVYPFSYYGVWGIYQKKTGQLIGRIGITELILHNQPEYVLEYFIHYSYRRCGYASECVNAILDYAKKRETDTICVCIHKQNTASLNVLSRCIFPYEEIQAEHVDIRCFRIYLNAERAILHSNA